MRRESVNNSSQGLSNNITTSAEKAKLTTKLNFELGRKSSKHQFFLRHDFANSISVTGVFVVPLWLELVNELVFGVREDACGSKQSPEHRAMQPSIGSIQIFK